MGCKQTLRNTILPMAGRHQYGPINHHLMLKVNNTRTFDEVHGWISNYFTGIYLGVDAEDYATGGKDENQMKKPYFV
eukprot:5064443-Amphidinium_carterae.1